MTLNILRIATSNVLEHNCLFWVCSCYSPTGSTNTVFVRISAAALIKFFASNMRRLFEGGAYLKKETKHFLF